MTKTNVILKPNKLNFKVLKITRSPSASESFGYYREFKPSTYDLPVHYSTNYTNQTNVYIAL